MTFFDGAVLPVHTKANKKLYQLTHRQETFTRQFNPKQSRRVVRVHKGVYESIQHNEQPHTFVFGAVQHTHVQGGAQVMEVVQPAYVFAFDDQKKCIEELHKLRHKESVYNISKSRVSEGHRAIFTEKWQSSHSKYHSNTTVQRKEHHS